MSSDARLCDGRHLPNEPHNAALAVAAERARLVADQHRIARELNEFSQRSGYAVGHTESPRYRELCAQAEANAARLREISEPI